MKKVSKKTKIITVATCFLILVGTIAFNVVTAPHVKKEVTPMNMDKVWIVEDSDGDGTVSKGDLIELENVDYNKDKKTDRFRVMKTDGNRYTLMSLEKNNTAIITYKANVEEFDGKYGISYRKSSILSWCNSYFCSLPEYVQDAVVEQKIKQSMYRLEYKDPDEDPATDACMGKYFYMYDSPAAVEKAKEYADEYRVELTKVSEIDAGTYSVYIPDVDDILEYLGDNSQPYNFNTLYGEDDSGLNICLRSAVEGYPDRICSINMVANNFGDFRGINENCFSPMFTVEIE